MKKSVKLYNQALIIDVCVSALVEETCKNMTEGEKGLFLLNLGAIGIDYKASYKAKLRASDYAGAPGKQVTDDKLKTMVCTAIRQFAVNAEGLYKMLEEVTFGEANKTFCKEALGKDSARMLKAQRAYFRKVTKALAKMKGLKNGIALAETMIAEHDRIFESMRKKPGRRKAA